MPFPLNAEKPAGKMDDAFVKNWIEGLMQGICQLPQKEREALLCCCAERCARSFPLALYQQASQGAGENLSAFFSLLGENAGIQTKEIIPQKQYEIQYAECGCDWHVHGYTDSSALCECSRQSILYCVEQVLPWAACRVSIGQSLLAGDGCCRFLVEMERRERVLAAEKRACD